MWKEIKGCTKPRVLATAARRERYLRSPDLGSEAGKRRRNGRRQRVNAFVPPEGSRGAIKGWALFVHLFVTGACETFGRE